MRILICNDDGIHFPGIVALAKAMTVLGEVYIFAPDVERSAASNALTLGMPLRVKEVPFEIPGVKAFSTSGTPADCAKLGIDYFEPEKPDLVVSGINKGPNMCCDIMYSGTVAAAYEGAYAEILSLAVSLNSYSADVDYNTAAEWAVKCTKRLMDSNADKRYVYNINVPNLPADQIKGLKVTKMGFVEYRGGYEKRVDPYGKPYYWVNGKPVVIDKNSECDNNSVADGFVSLTPLTRDYTAYELVNKLKEDFGSL